MITRTFYALRRDAEYRYLAEGGASFAKLGAKNFLQEHVKEFTSIQDVIKYLRTNVNVPDVTAIVKINEVMPEVVSHFEETVIG